MNVTLREIRQETEEASTFFFTPEGPVTYSPGQHIILRLPIDRPDERGTIRTFTLSSSPTEERLSITTKRGPSSFKQALFGLPVGTVIEARGPAGNFVLHEKETRTQIMLTGGIGITPVRSMLKYALDKHLSISIVLLYSNKIPEEIVFRRELESLVTNLSNFTLVETMTRPEESKESWQGKVGRIDERLIRNYTTDMGNTLFYTCGPKAMVDAMVELLNSLGVPRTNIILEQFPGY